MYCKDQDTIYLAVKCKASLLNPNVALKMDPTYKTGAYYIEMLLEIVTRGPSYEIM